MTVKFKIEFGRINLLPQMLINYNTEVYNGVYISFLFFSLWFISSDYDKYFNKMNDEQQ